MDSTILQSTIESILFVAGEPLSVQRLMKITGEPKAHVDNALMALRASYAAPEKGLTLLTKDEAVQLVTKAEHARFVDAFVAAETEGPLSQASLEVLSIIAYRGPIARHAIEAIRGVNCSFTLRALLLRGLIERTNNPADSRSILYRVSFDFLKTLGVDQVEKLPAYDTLSKDDRVESIISQTQHTQQ